MAQSLNQAFIQAFKKSGPTPQPTEESNAEAGNDFVVRIDTATLSAPEPHFLKRAQRPRPSAPAGTSMPTPAGTPELASPPTSDTHPSTRTAPERAKTEPTGGGSNSVRDSVRDSIAAQMQQASDLERNAQFQSFFGSEIVTSSGSTHTPIASGHESAALDAEIEAAPVTADVNSEERDSDHAVAAQADYWEQAMAEEEPAISASTAVTQPEKHKATRRQPPAASRPAVFEPQVTPEPPTKLDAPTSPALSPDEVEKIVANYVKKHGNGGEIFRLDRPTYGSDTNATDEPSGDSISFEEQESWTQIDAVEAEPSEPAASETVEAQKQIEEDLRHAKMRSFNAVWEVDQLQWPEVCQELMAACETSLTQVAINLGKASHEGLQVLAVTSPQAGDGRTTVACCLAKVAATAGLRVAIVDGDIENPTLCYQTNLDLEDDWKSAIFRQLPLEEVAVHSLDDQLTVIPLLEPIEDFEIDSDDNRIAFMLQQLSESFDLVVVDMGHMDSKRSLVMPMTEQGIVNAVLAVVDHRQTTPQRVEACLRRIRRTGIASIGIVENFAS